MSDRLQALAKRARRDQKRRAKLSENATKQRADGRTAQPWPKPEPLAERPVEPLRARRGA